MAVTGPDLVPGVMSLVRSDSRSSRLLPVPAVGGPAFVAQHAVAAVVEHALDGLSALQVHTCTVRPDTDGSLDVRLVVAAAHGVDLIALADRARETVRHTVSTQFGWPAPVVDIEVDDLYPTEEPA